MISATAPNFKIAHSFKTTSFSTTIQFFTARLPPPLKIIAMVSVLISLAESSFAANTFTASALDSENRSPVIQHFGLSRPQHYRPLKNDAFRIRSQFEISNYLSNSSDGDKRLFIDGETWIWSNRFQYSVANEDLLEISIPWIRQSAGLTDRLIYDFHDLFKLPQNGRKDDQHDQLNLFVRDDSGVVFNIDDESSNIGDIAFNYTIAKPVFHGGQLNVKFELPTGNFDEQAGSGGVDLGASLFYQNPEWLQQREWLKNAPLALWYGGGINYVTHHDSLDDFDPIPLIMTGRAGLAWKALSSFILKTQLDMNTPFYQSDIRELGWIPLQISIGAEYIASEDLMIDFILIEDLRPRVTPDVIFSLGITSVF